MRKPTSLKIFGQKYRIRYDLTDDDKYGLTDSQTNQIHIRNNLQNDKQIRVLMHEITHAVIAESLLCDRKRFTEEEICDLVGFHITDTLLDNPDIVEWIFADQEK